MKVLTPSTSLKLYAPVRVIFKNSSRFGDCIIQYRRILAKSKAVVECTPLREIRKVYFLENKDHAEDHFTLDPRDQINAIRDMRANGLKPLGNWHSHPSSPSRPSVEDIRLAFDSKASYLILSLMADYPVLNSFHIEGGEWTKEDLRIYSEEYYF